jgi:hypothetical protein
MIDAPEQLLVATAILINSHPSSQDRTTLIIAAPWLVPLSFIWRIIMLASALLLELAA